MDNEQNFILAKMDGCAADANIVRVVRAYLSRRRAEEDLLLLEKNDGASTYRVIPVDFIDN